MNFKQAMTELEAQGTDQNRKVYARHGVRGECFGVSYANLGKLRRKIKTDHELAAKLWDSGNHDARVLATMVADPTQLGARQLDQWVRDCEDYVTADAVAALASRTTHFDDKIAKWTKSRSEFTGQAGWTVLANVAVKQGGLPQPRLKEYLKVIESDIHDSKNRVRHAMNNALIAIGLCGPQLERLAKAAAKRIGPVEVDHGETGCKTPDAISYIERAVARRALKEASPTS